ncbi:MAG: hypothetical protein PHU07_09140 [Acidocella sp.]|nr:hypothetical protein [Acidocella sp.]
MTRAVAQQRRTELFQRRFRLAIEIFYVMLVGFLLLHWAGGGLSAAERVAQPGDMLRIAANEVPPGARASVVPANLVLSPQGRAGRTCTLDEHVMLKPGGTLTVLEVLTNDVVLVWAGGATAAGADACPKAAQLLVSNANYEKLYAVMQVPKPMNPR